MTTESATVGGVTIAVLIITALIKSGVPQLLLERLRKRAAPPPPAGGPPPATLAVEAEPVPLAELARRFRERKQALDAELKQAEEIFAQKEAAP